MSDVISLLDRPLLCAATIRMVARIASPRAAPGGLTIASPACSRRIMPPLSWPYLLRDVVVDQPDQVWRADLTYIPMRRGFLYLVAVLDWATRKVLSWRVSNTMDVEFCLEALKEALAWFCRPDVFNTDQGSQPVHLAAVHRRAAGGRGARVDGRAGRWMDNVFIKRLWRSLKYECVYLHAFETGSELRAGLARWISYHNARRPHSTLAGHTPDEAYGTGEKQGADGTRTEKLAA